MKGNETMNADSLLPGSGVLYLSFAGITVCASTSIATELPKTIRDGKLSTLPHPEYIGKVRLSMRVRRILAREGIETVDQLCRYPASVLMKARNFGDTSLREVEEALDTIGRKLPNPS